MRKELTGLHDIITPSALEFQTQTITFGDQIAKVIVITDYPPDVGPGWIARIAQLPGVTCSIHIQPTDPLKLVEQINKSIGELTSRVLSGGNALSVQRAGEQLEQAKTLIKKIDAEQQQVFYFCAVLLVIATDQDSLSRRVKRIEAALAGAGMRGRSLLFRQEDGLKAAGPWHILSPEVAVMGNRNMPSETVAASFPFTNSGINDGEGIILGRDKDGGIILVDIWRRGGDRTNSNWTVLGKPGVGKSTTVKKLLANEYAQGCKIIVIDPEREYKDLCENVQGDWIDCGGSTGGRINPLQVREAPTGDDEREGAGKGAVSAHFQTLRTFFRLYMKDLLDSELAMLEQIVEELYRKQGITWDTDPGSIKDGKWPIIKDLYNLIREKEQQEPEDWKKLSLLIRRIAEGADSALWNGQTTIKTDSDFIVLDVFALQESSDEIKRAQYFNILSWAWNEISRDRREKVILAVDEAYLLVDPETPQALQFLRNTSKRIRKYGGSLMVISQNVNDFLDGAVRRHGQALLDNPCYKLIMGQGEKDLQSLVQLMHLSEAEQEMLAQGKRAEALLVAGSKRVHVKVELAAHEPDLFGEAGGR